MKRWIQELFYIPEQEKITDKKLHQQLALSVFLILLYLFSMALAAYALFSVEYRGTFLVSGDKNIQIMETVGRLNP